MANRISEVDKRPRSAPAINCNVTLGAVFSPVSSVVWLNVTVAGTVIFHMMDGSSVTQAFPVGFFVLDIQCDTITLGGGTTATASALANPP